jgi:hypothetical protein
MDVSDRNKYQKLLKTYWGNYKEIINRLLKSGKNIYVLYPIPELPMHIDKILTPYSIFSNARLLNPEQLVSEEEYFGRNAFIIDKLDSLPFGEKLHSIKPFDIFCKLKACSAVKNTKVLYSDKHHLSLDGAKVLINYTFGDSH